MIDLQENHAEIDSFLWLLSMNVSVSLHIPPHACIFLRDYTYLSEHDSRISRNISLTIIFGTPVLKLYTHNFLLSLPVHILCAHADTRTKSPHFVSCACRNQNKMSV